MSEPLSDVALQSLLDLLHEANKQGPHSFSAVQAGRRCLEVVPGLVALVRQLQKDVVRLQDENERLRRGDFTEEEFQNLCHNLEPCDRARYEAGCRAYQDKLFGPGNPRPIT